MRLNAASGRQQEGIVTGMNQLGIEVLFTLIMAASTFCHWWDERGK